MVSYETPPGQFSIDASWSGGAKISSPTEIRIKSPWSSSNSLSGGEIANGIGFSVDNKMYFGVDSKSQNNTNLTNDLWELDASGSQQKKTSFPGPPRSASTAVVVNQKAYLISGKDQSGLSLGDFWQYAPSDDRWTQLENFPGDPRFESISVATESDIYFGMGQKGSQYLRDIWKYNVEAATWTNVTTYPGIGRTQMLCFIIGDDLFLGGGYYSAKDLWKYNTKTGIWSKLNNMPFEYGPTESANFVIDGFSYVAPGQSSVGQVWKYDPKTDTWVRLPNMVLVDKSNVAFSCVGINLENKGYFIGGYRRYGPEALSDEIWEFDPSVF